MKLLSLSELYDELVDLIGGMTIVMTTCMDEWCEQEKQLERLIESLGIGQGNVLQIPI